MPVLRDDSVLIMDGAVKLYRRERSRKWQAAFQIDGQYIRISTGKSDLDEAKQAASDSYLEYKFRSKNGVPVISKRFSDVAKLCISEMNKQLEIGVGKKVYRDYIIVIEKYLIPFFGNMHVNNITYETIQKFVHWREEKMGKEPKASTLNTHNSALNRVFDEAVARGFMGKIHVPPLINKGGGSNRRPDFTQEEYASMIRKLPHWINKTQHPKSVHMRELLRDYVLIMANTGMRHGTEAQNLKWQHITQFEDNGQSYLEMSVSGKTGRRDLLKQRLDLPVFRLRDGTVTNALHQTFRNFLKENELLICPRTGQARTLYSLRHSYATFALLNDGMDIHTLAIQMGTSIQMIERHYSHLTPRLRKDMLTGKRYELSKKEYLAQQSADE
jgi:integrase